MTAPSDPKATREPLAEEQEIILRLGDILPRVPAYYLKPGPHDTMSEIHFTVEELAEKISRGRVSVPLARLSSVCPEVFRDGTAFPNEQEVALPLQKVLEQVGLVVPKSDAGNAIPAEQLAEARARASRILESTAPAAPAPPPPPPAEPEPAAPAILPTISKAISAARSFFGLLGLHDEAPAVGAKPAVVSPAVSAEPSPSPPARETPEPPPPVQTAPPIQSPPEP